MRAVIITKQAPEGPVAPNVETVDDWPELESPQPGWVNLRTEVSALNHMDLWVGRGIPGVPIEYPKIGGVDACGVVEEVGEGVDVSWIGRRVVFNAAVEIPDAVRPDDPPASAMTPNYYLVGEHTQGTHAERFTAPAANLAPVGDADPVLAAALGTTFLTAYSMMLTKAQLRAGQVVLITGIGGGVSTAALALANWLGCRSVVTSRFDWKLERARELGAAHVILDKGQDWSKDVWSWSGKRGVDLVVDTVGASVHMSCIKSLARGGALTIAGATSGPISKINLAHVFWKQLRILGSTMGTNDELREVVSLFREGMIRPVVDDVIDPASAQQAWRRLEAGDQLGKLVLRWSHS